MKITRITKNGSSTIIPDEITTLTNQKLNSNTKDILKRAENKDNKQSVKKLLTIFIPVIVLVLFYVVLNKAITLDDLSRMVLFGTVIFACINILANGEFKTIKNKLSTLDIKLCPKGLVRTSKELTVLDVNYSDKDNTSFVRCVCEGEEIYIAKDKFASPIKTNENYICFRLNNKYIIKSIKKLEISQNEATSSNLNDGDITKLTTRAKRLEKKLKENIRTYKFNAGFNILFGFALVSSFVNVVCARLTKVPSFILFSEILAVIIVVTYAFVRIKYSNYKGKDLINDYNLAKMMINHPEKVIRIEGTVEQIIEIEDTDTYSVYVLKSGKKAYEVTSKGLNRQLRLGEKEVLYKLKGSDEYI